MKQASLPPPNRDRYSIRVVHRALDILDLLKDTGRPFTLQAASRQLCMPRSSAFRLFCTLENRGYVERTDGGKRYVAGLALVSFSRRSVSRSLSEAALRHMRELRDEFLETVNLAVLRDGRVFYVEMLESPHTFRMAAQIGMHAPLHSTALGKAIAAFLPKLELAALVNLHDLSSLTSRTITTSATWRRELSKIRMRGYSADNEETEDGATCLGAPIFSGPRGEVVGAISISGPTGRIRAIKHRAVRALGRACGATSRALGYGGSAMNRHG